MKWLAQGKSMCNLMIVVLILSGVVLAIIKPESVEGFSSFILAIFPIIATWMAAIFGGTFVNKKYGQAGFGNQLIVPSVEETEEPKKRERKKKEKPSQPEGEIAMPGAEDAN